MSNEGTEQECVVTISDLNNLLSELNKTVISFDEDRKHSVKIKSDNVEFMAGKVRGAEHIVAILKHYISTITI